MDVRNLSFQADSFDVAIDKGTMDAMMTAKGDVWVCHEQSYLINPYMSATQDPPQQVIDDCTKEVDEALRQAQTKNLL